MAKTRWLQFRGDHPFLEDGRYYTYDQLADAIGARYNCIKNRLYNKKFVTPDDMYLPYSRGSSRKQPNKRKPEDIKRLETQSEIMMDKYLRMKL